MTAIEKVDEFLDLMNQAETDTDRGKIKTEMFRYCYFLPKADWQAIQPQLAPFVEEIRQELLPTEPLLQRAEELLNRLKMQKAVLQA
jgi:hypothetical protein